MDRYGKEGRSVCNKAAYFSFRSFKYGKASSSGKDPFCSVKELLAGEDFSRHSKKNGVNFQRFILHTILMKMESVGLPHCDVAQETWRHRVFVSSCFVALQLPTAAAAEWEDFFPAGGL